MIALRTPHTQGITTLGLFAGHFTSPSLNSQHHSVATWIPSNVHASFLIVHSPRKCSTTVPITSGSWWVYLPFFHILPSPLQYYYVTLIQRHNANDDINKIRSCLMSNEKGMYQCKSQWETEGMLKWTILWGSFICKGGEVDDNQVEWSNLRLVILLLHCNYPWS